MRTPDDRDIHVRMQAAELLEGGAQVALADQAPGTDQIEAQCQGPGKGCCQDEEIYVVIVQCRECLVRRVACLAGRKSELDDRA